MDLCRRLEELRRRVPAVSSSALSAVVRDIAVHGIPQLHSSAEGREMTCATVVLRMGGLFNVCV